MPPIKSFGERIADALVEDGLLSTKQVEELLELQKKEGTRLLKLILEKSYVSELDMVVSMGRVLNVPPVNLGRIASRRTWPISSRVKWPPITKCCRSRAWTTNCSSRWPILSTCWRSTTSSAAPNWTSCR